MSVLESVKAFITDRESGDVAARSFECADCGHRFETRKNDDRRISCPECLGSEVDEV